MDDDQHSDRPRHALEPPLTPAQLQGLQWGIAATIMPVDGRWRVGFFSSPTFRDEPGEDFATFQAAIDAVVELLPAANSEERREWARQELRDRSADA